MTPHPTLAEIIEATATHEGILPGALISDIRTEPLVKARRIAAMLMRSRRNMSVTEITAALSYDAHSSVVVLLSAIADAPELTDAAERVARIIEHTRRKLSA